MWYAAICAIAKNETPFLEEWTRFHLSIGFEHIFVYDNGSDIPVSSVLAEFIRAGLVTAIDFPGTEDQQRRAYMDFLHRFGTRCRWTAFIDLDEFVVPKTSDDIRDLLDGYADFGGLGISWKIFGSCGHVKRPAGGVIDNYDRVIEKNCHIKSIVQPERVNALFTSHNFGYKDGYFCVNEDGIPIATHQSYHVSRTVQINHYFYKSLEDFTIKIKKGSALGPNRLDLSWFMRQQGTSGELDAAAQKLAARTGCARATVQTIARILNDCERPSGEFLALLTDSIAVGKTALTSQLLKRYLRYHDDPIAHLIAAKVSLSSGDSVTFLMHMQRLLCDVGNPLRNEAFALLADFYEARQETQTAADLRRLQE
ncbi:MAG: glycosyltransferase family 92 protein [Desulfovibrio sp.]|nr:glycosyltransferase family 92 protein [Desulfovibrio sp.]